MISRFGGTFLAAESGENGVGNLETRFHTLSLRMSMTELSRRGEERGAVEGITCMGWREVLSYDRSVGL
jgi:hypothetical protein